MVDFETQAPVFNSLGVRVVALSVDSVEETRTLADGFGLKKVKLIAEVDGPATADALGIHRNDDPSHPYLHAAGFLLDPDGEVVVSVVSSGAIGRFSASDVIRTVTTHQG